MSPEQMYGDHIQRGVDAFCEAEGIQRPRPPDAWYGIGKRTGDRIGFFIIDGAPEGLAVFLAAWSKSNPFVPPT